MTERGPVRPRLGFATNSLRRDGETRTDATLAEAMAHPGATFHLLGTEGWLLRNDRPVFDAGTAGSLASEDATLLGFDAADRPVIAARVTDPSLPTGFESQNLRALASSDRLAPELEGRLGQGEHLLNWHRRARFCGLCGGSTVAEAAGYRRRCTRCGEAHFPRTDPVAIMLVEDEDHRCLLGRGAHFPPGMWSCLAGFVEAGETLEAAVRRETKEEAGVDVGSVAYHSSQPWPFPNSLMIGCLAKAVSTAVVFDHAELEACRWFERSEVRAMLEERHPEGLTLPKPFAIAHHLIRAYLDAER